MSSGFMHESIKISTGPTDHIIAPEAPELEPVTIGGEAWPINKWDAAQYLIDTGKADINGIAEQYDVHKSTVYRNLRKCEIDAAKVAIAAAIGPYALAPPPRQHGQPRKQATGPNLTLRAARHLFHGACSLVPGAFADSQPRTAVRGRTTQAIHRARLMLEVAEALAAGQADGAPGSELPYDPCKAGKAIAEDLREKIRPRYHRPPRRALREAGVELTLERPSKPVEAVA